MFVGRDEALGMLVSSIEAAAAGRGVVVLVAGEPGIGKSRLVAEALGRIELRVVWAACWEGDGAPAFWPWRQLLRGLDDDVTDPAITERTAATAGLIGEQSSGEPGVRFGLFDAVVDAL